jgi:hypothetical protein
MQGSEGLITFARCKIMILRRVIYPILINVAETDFISARTECKNKRKVNIIKK